ncbi:hypothetical protein [Streptomyces sp. NPDC059597]|uniref:hypothetical protein n=1 Tax=Streptomyces sp. NPDC059597 TaxID=3346879 RepID=UPI0036985DA9
MDRWGPEEVEHGAVGDGEHWPTAAEGGQGPYGHPHPQAHSHGPAAPPAPRRGSGSTVLLVVVALVVVLGAGGSVYALLHGGSPTATPPVDSPAAPAVPSAYLGTWRSPGHRLTLTQGGIGDDVLTLVTDTPARHCVSTAPLTGAAPHSLRFGTPTLASGAPLSSCSPGTPAVLTLLSDGRLRSTPTAGGGSRTFTRR